MGKKIQTVDSVQGNRRRRLTNLFEFAIFREMKWIFENSNRRVDLS